MYGGSEVKKVLQILYLKSLKPYGSSRTYETYMSNLEYDKEVPKHIFFLNYKNCGGNDFFSKKTS